MQPKNSTLPSLESLENLLAATPDERVAQRLRKQFANAFQPHPGTYWLDLLLSTVVGWTAFYLSLHSPFGSLAYFAATIIALIALLRATLFIHEIAHCKRGSLPGFEIAWHLFVGLPFMLPSLVYVGSHGDHHRPNVFGTANDPEYASLAHGNILGLGRFVLGVLFVPALLVLRWGILGPLSHSIPPLRKLVVRRASTLVINPAYSRPVPKKQHRARWIIQEWAAALVVWLVCVSWLMGQLPMAWILKWYTVTTGMLVLNQVRTLAAHRYRNSGRQLSLTEQLLDSINLSGWPVLTVLAAPVGLRYHALHHLLPNVPYHSLGRLHRQLQNALPVDSSYNQAGERGILSAIQDLVRRMRQHRTRTSVTEEHVAEEA